MTGTRTALIAPILTASLLAVVPAGSASAAIPVLAHGALRITHSGGVFQVCASGSIDSPPTVAAKWVFAIVGGRVTTDTGEVVDGYSTAEDGPTFPLDCEWVTPDATAAGSFSANLTLVSAGVDVTGLWGGLGSWDGTTLTEQHYGTN